jgi:hypothetical protein
VPIEDLQNLAKWLDTDPTVPSGRWFKRFAKIIVCGEDELVKTILEDSHSAIGSEVERMRESSATTGDLVKHAFWQSQNNHQSPILFRIPTA